jgi:hypothetical protein
VTQKLLGWAAALALLLFIAFAAVAGAAAVRPCASLVVADPIADPGNLQPAGAALDVDLGMPVDQNAAVLGGIGPSAFFTSVAVAPVLPTETPLAVYVTDMEANVTGTTPDPGGEPGRGAVFQLLDTGNIVVVSDGTQCGPTILNCDPVLGGVFVDPIGLDYGFAADVLLVADPDADPSGLGPDSNGFSGHGAVFAVDRFGGTVNLVADGARYRGTIPNGAPSIFEDPIAVVTSRDGRIFVADQLAKPLGPSYPGAIFEVLRTGDVLLTSAAVEFRGVRDVAVEPAGTVLVLDRLAGANGGGTLFRIDPTLPPQANVAARLTSPLWIEAMGVVVAGDGEIFVVDASADPLQAGLAGAIFRVDPALSAVTPASSTDLYASPWGIALTSPETLTSANPPDGPAGTSLRVMLVGGQFEPGVGVDFGPGVSVDNVTWMSPQLLAVDITIDPLAPPGFRDVRAYNPVWRTFAFHCELFEVMANPGCAPVTPIGGTLRVTKPAEGHVRLEWDGTGDPCTASFRVRRAFTPRPATDPGDWPVDPAFGEVTGDDVDGRADDPTFEHVATPGANEYYLVTEVGTNGAEGPVGHYGG